MDILANNMIGKLRMVIQHGIIMVPSDQLYVRNIKFLLIDVLVLDMTCI